LIDVVARIRHVHERSDPRFVSFRCEQHHSRFGFRHPQLNPALFLIEWLIGDDGEPKFLGVKIEGSVLVDHRDADELDLLDHDAPYVIPRSRLRLEMSGDRLKKSLSVYRYSG